MVSTSSVSRAFLTRLPDQAASSAGLLGERAAATVGHLPDQLRTALASTRRPSQLLVDSLQVEPPGVEEPGWLPIVVVVTGTIATSGEAALEPRGRHLLDERVASGRSGSAGGP